MTTTDHHISQWRDHPDGFAFRTSGPITEVVDHEGNHLFRLPGRQSEEMVRAVFAIYARGEARGVAAGRAEVHREIRRAMGLGEVGGLKNPHECIECGRVFEFSHGHMCRR